jgi:hypothetical protein
MEPLLMIVFIFSMIITFLVILIGIIINYKKPNNVWLSYSLTECLCCLSLLIIVICL